MTRQKCGEKNRPVSDTTACDLGVQGSQLPSLQGKNGCDTAQVQKAQKQISRAICADFDFTSRATVATRPSRFKRKKMHQLCSAFPHKPFAMPPPHQENTPEPTKRRSTVLKHGLSRLMLCPPAPRHATGMSNSPLPVSLLICSQVRP